MAARDQLGLGAGVHPQDDGGDEPFRLTALFRVAVVPDHRRLERVHERGDRRLAVGGLTEGTDHVDGHADGGESLALDVADQYPGAPGGGRHVVDVAPDELVLLHRLVHAVHEHVVGEQRQRAQDLPLHGGGGRPQTHQRSLARDAQPGSVDGQRTEAEGEQGQGHPVGELLRGQGHGHDDDDAHPGGDERGLARGAQRGGERGQEDEQSDQEHGGPGHRTEDDRHHRRRDRHQRDNARGGRADRDAVALVRTVLRRGRRRTRRTGHAGNLQWRRDRAVRVPHAAADGRPRSSNPVEMPEGGWPYPCRSESTRVIPAGTFGRLPDMDRVWN